MNVSSRGAGRCEKRLGDVVERRGGSDMRILSLPQREPIKGCETAREGLIPPEERAASLLLLTPASL